MFRFQVHRQNRRVNLRRGKVRVAEHPLDQLHVGPAAQHVRGEGVTEDVAFHLRAGRDGPHVPPHHPPHRPAHDPPPARLDEKRRIQTRRRAPRRTGRGPDGPRRHGPPRADHERPDLAHVPDQEFQGRPHERQRPALAAFPMPHRQRPFGQAHVVQVQLDQFIPADAGGIENLQYCPVPQSPMGPDVRPRQDVLHFVFRRDVRRKLAATDGPGQMRRRVHRHRAPPRQEVEELPRRQPVLRHRRARQPPPAPPTQALHHPRLILVHVLARGLPCVVDAAPFQELDQRPQVDLVHLHRATGISFRLQPTKEGVPRLDQFHCVPPWASTTWTRSLGWHRFNSRFKSPTSTRKYTCVLSKLRWPRSR